MVGAYAVLYQMLEFLILLVLEWIEPEHEIDI